MIRLLALLIFALATCVANASMASFQTPAAALPGTWKHQQIIYYFDGVVEMVNYPNSASVAWDISVGSGCTVTGQLTYIDVEYHATCGYDRVYLADYNTAFASIPATGKFCETAGCTDCDTTLFNGVSTLARTKCNTQPLTQQPNTRAQNSWETPFQLIPTW